MSVAAGPNIIKNGLVLCLDAGNNKSFKGEPTTNLITSNFINGGDTTVVLSNEVDQYGVTRSLSKATINSTSGWTRIYISSSIGIPVINQNYTISMWIKRSGSTEVRAGWEPEVGQADGYKRPEVESGYYGIAGGTQPNIVSDEWTYITYTFRYTSTTTTNLVLFFYVNGNGGQILLSDPQIETKPYATPFVSGTRGSTVATGGGLFDLSNNNNHGTIVRNALPAASFYNTGNKGSLVFDGVDDEIIISPNDLYKFTNTQPFSFSTWLRYTNIGGAATIISFSLNNEASRGYYLMLIEPGVDNRFFFDYWDGGPFRGIQGNLNSIVSNEWIYLVATSSSNSVNDMKVYKNGVLTSFTNRGSDNPSTIDYNELSLKIGSRGGAYFFQGSLSQLSIYNRALSPTEILQNYNATKGRFRLT